LDFNLWLLLDLVILDMAPKRNRLSGAEYKKIAKLKQSNLNEIVKKTIKIDTMFKSKLFCLFIAN